MQWYYDSSDTDKFEQSIEMRLRRAESWAGTEVFDPDTAREALLFRHDSRDGRLGRWTPELVREFLTEIVPERFTGGIEHYAHVPEALRTWLRFLEHAGALDPHGSALSELERAVDECAEDFPAAFTDPANWGPARIAAERALAAGIDPSGPGGLDRLNAFTADETAGDDAVAAAVTRQYARRLRNQRMHPLPAAELPSPERAAALAAETEAVKKAAVFGEWLGEGCAVTQKGNLRKADAIALVELLGTGDDTDSFTSAADLPGLNWHTELMLGTGLARRARQRLVPVAKNAARARDPLALLLSAWKAEALWRSQGPAPFRARRDDDGSILRLMVEALLGSAHDTDMPVAEIRRRVAGAAYGDGDGPDDMRGMLASLTLYRDIDHMLTALHRFGAVEFDRDWAIDDDLGMADPAVEAAVRLTELGRYLLWTDRRETGLVAPVVGESSGRSAAVMLTSVVEHYGRAAGVEEIRRWLAENDDDPVSLLEAIAANPFRTRQSAMLGAATDAVGPELLDRAEQDPRLAPTALMLGGLRGRLDLAQSMGGTGAQRSQAVLAMAEQILETLEQLGPDGYVESVSGFPSESLEGMTALIAESDHPDRWLVELFTEEVVPRLGGPGARRRASLEAARDRARHVKRGRKKRPKRRR